MKTYVVAEDYLVDIADAIRAKTGTSDTMTIDEMPQKITDISGANLDNVNVTAADVLASKIFVDKDGNEQFGTMPTNSLATPFVEFNNGVFTSTVTQKTGYVAEATSSNSLTLPDSWAELNFKIAGGTTQPSNPKENTIWVNTAAPVTSWDFSAEEPHRRSKNKNLNVYPYYETTQTTNGITFTDNGDGTVTVSGTANGSTAYFACSAMEISRREFVIEPGTYTLSGGVGDDPIDKCALSLYTTADDWTTVHSRHVVGEQPVTFTIDKTVKARIFISVFVGTTLSNAVFKPQLEKGTAATEFVKGDAGGQVWIVAGMASPVEFNALKKNNITVHPISANQYVNGTWIIKTAQSYIGGAWKSWIRYLYNLGDKCTDLTGGWQTQAVGRGTTASPAYNQQAEKPVLTTQSNGGVKLHMDYGTGIYRTVNKIDLTGVSTITFNGTLKARVGGNWTGIYVWSEIGKYYVDNVAASLSLNAGTILTGDTTLDVSGLTGPYYIGLGLHENTVNSDSGYIIMNSLTIG